jgi:endoglucanase
MLWDVSGSFEVNSPQPYRDFSTIAVLTNAAAGVTNALADNTVDPAATTQWTSAYLFYKQGSAIAATELPFIWNGACLESIHSTVGNKLSKNAAWAIDVNNLTFTAWYMSALFPSGSANGFKSNLTLHFTAGADLQLEAYQWAAPTLASTSFTVTLSSAQNDLSIPVTWQGLPRLAAVKAVTANDTYLIDSWTKWLGPLQQGRLVCLFFLLRDSVSNVLTDIRLVDIG